jgi:hypothetical protein
MAAQQPTRSRTYYGGWRTLAYQLPGAYRFLDRLDLSEAQEKALDKVYRKWAADRRELMQKALASLEPLSKDDRKDPEKLRAYYAERRKLYQATQIPPPLPLVNDILTEEQLAKIGEADTVVAVWNDWLAKHMAVHEETLDGILGPPPPEEARVLVNRYRMFRTFLPGGQFIGRLALGPEQVAELDRLRRGYYAEYRARLAPVTYSLRGTEMDRTQSAAVRRAIAAKVRDDLVSDYRKRLEAVLTKAQRDRLSRAAKVVEEGDAAVQARYAEFDLELSAILPCPAEPTPVPSGDEE